MQPVAILVCVVALPTKRKTQKRQLQMGNRVIENQEARERARIAQTLSAELVAKLLSEPEIGQVRSF